MGAFGELLSQYNVVGAFWVTIQLTVASAVGSLILGTILAIMRVSPARSMRWAGAAYVNIVRNTPLTLVILACSVGLWGQLGVLLASRESETFIASNNFRLAVLGLSAYTAAFVCESLRSGINTVPAGQAEASRSLGMSFAQTMGLVILPQAFRGAVAPLGNTLIALTKNTTVVTAIGVAQVSHAMRRMIEFRSDVLFTVFGLVALTFIVLTLPMGIVTSWASAKWAVKR